MEPLDARDSYSDELSKGIFALGCLYLRVGHVDAAEKIFTGLSEIFRKGVPGALGLGVVRLINEDYQGAREAFRLAVQSGDFILEGRFGIALSSVGLGDWDRAQLALLQMRIEHGDVIQARSDWNGLWEAAVLRCDQGLRGTLTE